MKKKIAHITDIHLDEIFVQKQGISARTRLKKVLQHISSYHINEIVCTGDIGEDTGLSFFFKVCRKFNLSITLGNHDSYLKVINHIPSKISVTSKLYYSKEENQHKFIYLDSSSGEIDTLQLIWLQKELISEKQIIIFIHHPILKLSLKVDEIGALKNRNEVHNLLIKQTNNITVFCGHYHLNNTSTYKNITQHITPATSFQIKKHTDKIEIDSKYYGYRIIELNEAGISTKTQFVNDTN
ncbi:3',5'-cyclic-nucleotide phosphodiesterase [Tenacibaculum sp. 190130A14a]|uniref:Icc protein n=1 Tax=Tenacibaculum polynesiense TaxID=3137857 RepID=A0ABP1F593_9FLAO